jgi:hypothetical protein
MQLFLGLILILWIVFFPSNDENSLFVFAHFLWSFAQGNVVAVFMKRLLCAPRYQNLTMLGLKADFFGQV